MLVIHHHLELRDRSRVWGDHIITAQGTERFRITQLFNRVALKSDRRKSTSLNLAVLSSPFSSKINIPWKLSLFFLLEPEEMLIRPWCRVIANMGGEIRVQRLAPPLAVCLWTSYLIPFNLFLIFEMEKCSAIGFVYN